MPHILTMTRQRSISLFTNAANSSGLRVKMSAPISVNRLAKHVGKLARKVPRRDVGRTARGERHHDADRRFRDPLRASDGRNKTGRHGSDDNEMPHDVLPV